MSFVHLQIDSAVHSIGVSQNLFKISFSNFICKQYIHFPIQIELLHKSFHRRSCITARRIRKGPLKTYTLIYADVLTL